MQTEKVLHCPLCNEEHVLSATKDPDGNVVGWFCNRHKAMVIADTPRWNGVDAFASISKFARRNIDRRAIGRLDDVKAAGLSRKMAYLYIQTEWAQEAKVNYYFAQYHMQEAVEALRKEAAAKKVAG